MCILAFFYCVNENVCGFCWYEILFLKWNSQLKRCVYVSLIKSDGYILSLIENDGFVISFIKIMDIRSLWCEKMDYSRSILKCYSVIFSLKSHLTPYEINVHRVYDLFKMQSNKTKVVNIFIHYMYMQSIALSCLNPQHCGRLK